MDRGNYLRVPHLTGPRERVKYLSTSEDIAELILPSPFFYRNGKPYIRFSVPSTVSWLHRRSLSTEEIFRCRVLIIVQAMDIFIWSFLNFRCLAESNDLTQYMHLNPVVMLQAGGIRKPCFLTPVFWSLKKLILSWSQ